MNPHEKALNGIFDDLDEMESKKMFGNKEPSESDGDEKGVSITITVSPNGTSVDNMPMHEGGTVPKPELEADTFSGYDKGKDPEYKKGEMGMADGGIVQGETDDLTLPPFLRKKKK